MKMQIKFLLWEKEAFQITETTDEWFDLIELLSAKQRVLVYGSFFNMEGLFLDLATILCRTRTSGLASDRIPLFPDGSSDETHGFIQSLFERIDPEFRWEAPLTGSRAGVHFLAPRSISLQTTCLIRGDTPPLALRRRAG